MFNILTDASANISAELEPNTNGNSTTILAPYFKANLVFSFFVSIDISPRSKKYPFKQITIIESGYNSLVFFI